MKIMLQSKDVMKNMTESTELDDMRAQMAVLKEKLNKEEIVTDSLLKSTMKGKMSTINRQAVISICAAVFVLTYGNWVWHDIGASLWFIGGTSLLMIVCIVITILMHKKMSQTDITNGNLLTVAKNAKKLKEQYIKWQRIGIPLVCIWFVWFAVDLLIKSDDIASVLCLIGGGLIGGIVGGIYGQSMHKKVLRACDEIIKQIEE